MKPSSALYPLVLALASVCSAKLSFKSGSAVVNAKDGSPSQSLKFDPSQGTKPLRVAQDETLKLQFTVFDDAEKRDVQPHQTFLRFYDEKTDEEGIVPIKVGRDGKARFSMNLRKPPVGLPPTTFDPLHVSLILGSFRHEGAVYDLFDLSLPPSASTPPHPEESSFHVQPEIAHTFRPDQKSPPKFISLVFAGLVLSPWAVLLGLLRYLPISLQPDTKTLPFLACLASFEGLLFWYWVDLYLGQVLMYGAALGLATAIAGKRALSSFN
ncbi:hypothetical protein M407DRAFT_244508 [Tulasnella calospora MUT 4182]|uniref:Ribophorin II n=1 Tax=Tulasnella calospora MUT 4182 TaxID=1051891 RepID=A0A0C3QFX7_9AGAM|nr:hypothetical protein M407DRAFT_244508 [Tulasnella calospora MUT 4182]